MATYAYKCTDKNCENIFDMDFSMVEQKPLVYCPVCKTPAKRYITNPYVKYNGYGWGGKAELREAS